MYCVCSVEQSNNIHITLLAVRVPFAKGRVVTRVL
jgi:hypothetical protein